MCDSGLYHEEVYDARGIYVGKVCQKCRAAIRYPREDRCRFCNTHIGWIMNPDGEMVALGVCDSDECQTKATWELSTEEGD